MGKWCLGSSCSEITDQASPLGLPGVDFDVVNVSDFDGEFEGAGVPGSCFNEWMLFLFGAQVLEKL